MAGVLSMGASSREDDGKSTRLKILGNRTIEDRRNQELAEEACRN